MSITEADMKKAMAHFLIPEYPVHKDGVWHCPRCNHRIGLHHSYCHSCGQCLNWCDGRKPTYRER